MRRQSQRRTLCSAVCCVMAARTIGNHDPCLRPDNATRRNWPTRRDVVTQQAADKECSVRLGEGSEVQAICVSRHTLTHEAPRRCRVLRGDSARRDATPTAPRSCPGPAWRQNLARDLLLRRGARPAATLFIVETDGWQTDAGPFLPSDNVQQRAAARRIGLVKRDLVL